MAHQNPNGAPAPRVAYGCAAPENGLAEGTIVFTLDGALPVEYLSMGDRIITRSGARPLVDIAHGAAGFLLKFDQPQVFYADGIETRAA